VTSARRGGVRCSLGYGGPAGWSGVGELSGLGGLEDDLLGLLGVGDSDDVGGARNLDRPSGSRPLRLTRCAPAGMLRSSSPNKNQVGTERHSGLSPEGSASAAAVTGRWLTDIKAACSAGRSAAN